MYIKSYYYFRAVLLFILSVSLLPVNSQEALMTDMTNSITRSELEQYVYTLAADSMEGRFTGTAGQMQSAHYISDHFRGVGLMSFDSIPGYEQGFSLASCHWLVAEMAHRQKVISYPEEFLVLNDPPESHGSAEAIFGGYGIDLENYSDLSGLDVAGKIIIAFSGEPKNSQGKYRISGTEETSRDAYYYRKLRRARELGALGMVIVAVKSKDFKKYRKRYLENQRRRNLNYPGDTDTSVFFGLYTTLDEAALLLNIDEKKLLHSIGDIEEHGTSDLLGTKATVRYNFKKECKEVHTENVIGYTMGNGNSDEWVVVVAHYDHLGKDGKKIYYGADDNASGTAAVMELAEAFAEASQHGFKPMRNVAFVLVTAEEIGLYGSKYLLENLPFPREKVYAAVNIDMIGGMSNRYGLQPNYIGGWGYVSPDIVTVAEENFDLIAPGIHFMMSYSERRGGGSDHYYFVRNDIPSLFFFTGTHDDYHTPKDTPDKLLYGRMETTVRAIFGTVWSLANRTEPLKVAE